MSRKEVVLRAPLATTDSRWVFNMPELKDHARKDGKYISFTAEEMKLRYEKLPSNRIVHNDDPKCFIVVTFGELRFPEPATLAATRVYIKNFLAAGLTLNGVHYRFYHHSNSQLRGRSCFMRAAKTDAELDERIYALGSFRSIMSVAKRAKRIGLLFSGAEIDYDLKPEFTQDIEDITIDSELFSDGCGLMSRRLARNVSAKKQIIIRGKRYMPSVFQIRYRSYKGVLMIHPQLDRTPKVDVQFRASMKKFSTTIDTTLSIVDFSRPYAFARLNSDIVVLLSALGVPDERLIAKQAAYFKWLSDASSDPEAAANLLSSTNRHEMVERLLLDGFESPNVQNAIRAAQDGEIKDFRKDGYGDVKKERVRMMLPKSRFLFGVCDPYQVLKPGEVHVRVTSRDGITSLHAIDVMVIRNPCLHPGDLLKLRATSHPALNHLVDCVVFASQGKRAAPSMSSGGDLDGDRFTVCWDEDIVPATIAESYTYPAGRERISSSITRQDLSNHFAAYNGAGIARIASLHRKWVIATPKGAMSEQCQELNALHSLCVDGGSMKIPARLENPPEDPAKPFILDLLFAEARKLAEGFSKLRRQMVSTIGTSDADSAQELLSRLLESDDQSLAFTEEELINLILNAWRRNKVDPYRFLPHINWSAVSAQQKHALYATLAIDTMSHPYIWNSLITSDILSPRDLVSRRLNEPLRLQRLYTSRAQGRASFFEYLDRAMHDFVRKVIVLRIDNRITLGIFIRGRYEEEDSLVGENACVCSFEPTAAMTSATYRPMTNAYRLQYTDGLFQLYNKQKANTFIFIQRPPQGHSADLNISVALQMLDSRVQKQIGRVNRAPVPDVEIHVISERDREAHQLFDLRFTHVQTEDVMRRLDQERRPWLMNTLRTVDWSIHDELFKSIFNGQPAVVHGLLLNATVNELDGLLRFSVESRAYDHSFAIFRIFISRGEEYLPSMASALRRLPGLVYALLQTRIDDGLVYLSPLLASGDMMELIVISIIVSANEFGVAALVALENLEPNMRQLPLSCHLDFLWIAANSIRSSELCREVLFALAEGRSRGFQPSMAEAYALKHGLAIACDRAEEAADSCPCDERGHPTRQRTAPPHVKVFPVESKPYHVRVHVRVDAPSLARIGSHIRLRATATAANDGRSIDRIILDGIVTTAGRGELYVILFHPPPPELLEIQWLMYHAGITTTSRTMLEAVIKLTTEGPDVCQLHGIITGSDLETASSLGQGQQGIEITEEPQLERFNESQKAAVRSATVPFSLIWGPPGTGKTTVVVEILRRLVLNMPEDVKILMTASTHNAVDNVLERFIELDIVDSEKVVRAATDFMKVNKKLQRFTIDAQLGGSPTDNPKLIEKAKKRVLDAVIVFTTCAGAGLGLLRSANFQVVIVDEASQITEPMALIPLVKGCTQAILVGDHVQLRPTVRPLGKALEFDVSLLERLYTSPDIQSPDLSRLMLDVQYRFPEALAHFPSVEFYEGNLKTGTKWTITEQERLSSSTFPWPTSSRGIPIPNVFVPCAAPEDFGRASKGNEGQANLVAHIVKLLLTTPSTSEKDESVKPLGVSVLTPYSRQVKMLKEKLPEIECSTIDGFQGRENDIIVYSTVRSNPEGDLGFLDDKRRLNVAWTRAKYGRIVVGDSDTLSKTSDLWKRAIKDATEVKISLATSPVN